MYKLTLSIGVWSFLSCNLVFAENIGKVIGIQKDSWFVKHVSSSHGTKELALNDVIDDGDRIETVTNQSVLILFQDKTEVFLGPSSRMVIKNWNGRDATGNLKRKIFLEGGWLRAKVAKVYSQYEPFFVESKYAVAAVRGTEFVFEAGVAGRLSRVRRLSAEQMKIRKYEVEVHVLEGEVHVARNIDLVGDPAYRVALKSGEWSLVRGDHLKPEAKRSFNLFAFQEYIHGAVSKLELALNRNTTNEERAEIASYVRPESQVTPSRMIASPAQNLKEALEKQKKKRHPAGRLIERKRLKQSGE